MRAALARHTVVLVDIDLGTAWARAHGHGRPLARDRDAFEALYHAGAATYEAAADAVVPGFGRGAARALPHLRCGAIPEGHTLLWGTSASGDYPVWVGPVATAPWPAGGRRIVVTDATVADLQAIRN